MPSWVEENFINLYACIEDVSVKSIHPELIEKEEFFSKSLSMQELDVFSARNSSVSQDSLMMMEEEQKMTDLTIPRDKVVLIVDDELFNRMALCQILTANNIPNFAVASGDLACQRFKDAIA